MKNKKIIAGLLCVGLLASSGVYLLCNQKDSSIPDEEKIETKTVSKMIDEQKVTKEDDSLQITATKKMNDDNEDTKKEGSTTNAQSVDKPSVTGSNVSITKTSSNASIETSSIKETTKTEDNVSNISNVKPNHVHEWIPQYQTVHHEAQYETRYVVDQAARTEQVPVYEMREYSMCSYCGADVTGNTSAHAKQHMMNGQPGGHHSEWKSTLVGYDVVTHPEVGHNEQVLVKEAYDEIVAIGYKCSCGATK